MRQVIIKRRVDGPSVPELGAPTAVTFDSVRVPLVRPSTGPAAIASYEIQRSLDGTNWTTAATGALVFGNPPTQYVDGGRLASTTYFYRARATDAGGRISDYSAPVSVTTPANSVAAVLSTRFAGLALVQTNSYSNGIERRLNGTDAATGQAFTSVGPGIYGATSPMILQALGFNPGTDWQVEVVNNAPGNRTALRVRRTVAYSQPPAHQVAARLRPGVIWSGQGELYFRVKWFMPAAFPVTANGFLMLAEVKCNGSDETEDRIAWLMTREPFNGADRFFSKLAATWTNGTPQGVWTSSTPVTPAQDSAILSSFYNQGAFTDSDGLTLPERGRYVTTEMAFCLQDSFNRVSGNRSQGYVVCASSVGTATAPPANGTGLVRHRVLGRNMSQPFAASDPSGIGIAFPFNVYSDMPIQGLDFFIESVEVYEEIPNDASFASPLVS